MAEHLFPGYKNGTEVIQFFDLKVAYGTFQAWAAKNDVGVVHVIKVEGSDSVAQPLPVRVYSPFHVIQIERLLLPKLPPDYVTIPMLSERTGISQSKLNSILDRRDLADLEKTVYRKPRSVNTRVKGFSPEDAAQIEAVALSSMCRVPGCSKRLYEARRTGEASTIPRVSEAINKHYCGTHTANWLVNDDPAIPIEEALAVGMTTYAVGPDGYILDSRGNITLHRRIFELKFGRPLTQDEGVHHKNRIRWDNRDSNLEIWYGGQPPGARVEDILKDLRERYPELYQQYA